jgi:hypothetical protein
MRMTQPYLIKMLVIDLRVGTPTAIMRLKNRPNHTQLERRTSDGDGEHIVTAPFSDIGRRNIDEGTLEIGSDSGWNGTGASHGGISAQPRSIADDEITDAQNLLGSSG